MVLNPNFRASFGKIVPCVEFPYSFSEMKFTMSPRPFVYEKKKLQDEKRINRQLVVLFYLALEVAQKHSIFKTTAKLYQLFLSAAQSVFKNKGIFSMIWRIALVKIA